VVGVLGSGQLGRMFAIAARRMGYRVHTLSPDEDTPTGQVADVEIKASYADLDRVRDFARAVDVVTFEFENIPRDAAETAAQQVPVRPRADVLHTTQNRLREKNFLASAGVPIAPFKPVSAPDQAAEAVKAIGTPAVLKSAGFGYDGKGQKKIMEARDAEAAFRSVGGQASVVEAFIPFEKEVSVVAARGLDGAFVPFAVFENAHANHILDVTVVPAAIPQATAREAVDIARAIFEKLDVVGVMCVEFFLTREGRLLVNELAPRPHNSGHVTIDACVTSQFEQQLRAVCGLPLGAPDVLRPGAMANLLGDLWQNGEPNWPALLAFPDVKLHLYGKVEARPGRKMGHLTALADTPDAARNRVLAAREALRPAQAGSKTAKA
jgi:5-(carboxyamino)imidazole ribonucleotide synthase